MLTDAPERIVDPMIRSASTAQREQIPALISSDHKFNYISPINVEQFKLELSQHPDRTKTQYVINGLQRFPLLFKPDAKLKSAAANFKSSREPILQL